MAASQNRVSKMRRKLKRLARLPTLAGQVKILQEVKSYILALHNIATQPDAIHSDATAQCDQEEHRLLDKYYETCRTTAAKPATAKAEQIWLCEQVEWVEQRKGEITDYSSAVHPDQIMNMTYGMAKRAVTSHKALASKNDEAAETLEELEQFWQAGVELWEDTE